MPREGIRAGAGATRRDSRGSGERGHSSIKTTTVYTHLTKTAVDRIQSPLDRMVDIKGKKKLEE